MFPSVLRRKISTLSNYPDTNSNQNTNLENLYNLNPVEYDVSSNNKTNANNGINQNCNNQSDKKIVPKGTLEKLIRSKKELNTQYTTDCKCHEKIYNEQNIMETPIDLRQIEMEQFETNKKPIYYPKPKDMIKSDDKGK